jgi:hypothetical protein
MDLEAESLTKNKYITYTKQNFSKAIPESNRKRLNTGNTIS